MNRRQEKAMFARMNWKNIGPGTYEGTRKDIDRDFVIEKTPDGTVLSVFNSKVKNPDKAHIESFNVDNVKEAKKDAENYKADK